jgi:hypothetical protein
MEHHRRILYLKKNLQVRRVKGYLYLIHRRSLHVSLGEPFLLVQPFLLGPPFLLVRRLQLLQEEVEVVEEVEVEAEAVVEVVELYHHEGTPFY